MIASLIVTNSLNTFAQKFKLVLLSLQRLKSCKNCKKKPKLLLIVLLMTAQQTMSFGIVWSAIISMENSAKTV